MLSLGELDVSGPATDGAHRNAEAASDHPNAKTIHKPEPSSLFSLHWLHERMFACGADAKNYTHGPYAPMV